MKLKLHSFDFEECTLTFSIPKEIMHCQMFGNVPGGVEVDLGAITGNSDLGIKELAEQTTNKQMDAIASVDKYMTTECVAMSTRWSFMQEFRAWLQQHHL